MWLSLVGILTFVGPWSGTNAHYLFLNSYLERRRWTKSM